MPMPYTLTKGPLFTVMEQTLNDATSRPEVLQQLHDTTRLADIPWVTTGSGSAVQIPGVLRDRLFADWFGYRQDGNGAWQPQPPTFTGQSTGYWVGYFGNTEAVVREALIRTLEVAGGMSRGVQSPTTREWPIEVAWKCPNPYFEVWISWQKRGSGPTDGHVTMLICTPPDRNNRLVTDVQFPPPPSSGSAVPTPLPDPTAATADEGMWLVAYKKHTPTVGYQVISFPSGEVVDAVVNGGNALAPSMSGQWNVPVPSTFWVDGTAARDVVVVAPPAYAGGV